MNYIEYAFIVFCENQNGEFRVSTAQNNQQLQIIVCTRGQRK